MTGRPSDYSDALAADICGRLAIGESLRAICETEGMPDKSTVFRWLAINPVFRDQYARAREAQADYYAEEILEISDDGSRDYGRKDSDGLPVFDSDHVQRSRLRVDSRKWFASKVAPKKYGDKLELAGDKENPLAVTISGLRMALGTKLDRIPEPGSAPKSEG